MLITIRGCSTNTLSVDITKEWWEPLPPYVETRRSMKEEWASHYCGASNGNYYINKWFLGSICVDHIIITDEGAIQRRAECSSCLFVGPSHTDCNLGYNRGEVRRWNRCEGYSDRHPPRRNRSYYVQALWQQSKMRAILRNLSSVQGDPINDLLLGSIALIVTKQGVRSALQFYGDCTRRDSNLEKETRKCYDCDYYGNNPHLQCAVHPYGVASTCPDYLTGKPQLAFIRSRANWQLSRTVEMLTVPHLIADILTRAVIDNE